jgi:hypothetical protein
MATVQDWINILQTEGKTINENDIQIHENHIGRLKRCNVHNKTHPNDVTTEDVNKAVKKFKLNQQDNKEYEYYYPLYYGCLGNTDQTIFVYTKKSENLGKLYRFITTPNGSFLESNDNLKLNGMDKLYGNFDHFIVSF